MPLFSQRAVAGRLFPRLCGRVCHPPGRVLITRFLWRLRKSQGWRLGGVTTTHPLVFIVHCSRFHFFQCFQGLEGILLSRDVALKVVCFLFFSHCCFQKTLCFVLDFLKKIQIYAFRDKISLEVLCLVLVQS